MARIHTVDWRADAWLAGTSMLGPAEGWLYITIVNLIYSRGEAIEADVAWLGRVANMHGNAVRAALRRLIDLGKVRETGGKLMANGCEKYLETAEKRLRNWVGNGGETGRPSSNNNAVEKAPPSHARADTRSEPLSTIHQPPIEEKEREAKASPKKGSRWDGVVSLEWVREAAMVRSEAGLPPINATLEADKFADYWASRAGAGGLKLSWHKTWLNWVRNAKEERRNGQERQSPATKLYAGFAEAAGYRSGDSPADEPFLDGGRSDGDSPGAGRGLARRPG